MREVGAQRGGLDSRGRSVEEERGNDSVVKYVRRSA